MLLMLIEKTIENVLTEFDNIRAKQKIFNRRDDHDVNLRFRRRAENFLPLHIQHSLLLFNIQHSLLFLKRATTRVAPTQTQRTQDCDNSLSRPRGERLAQCEHVIPRETRNLTCRSWYGLTLLSARGGCAFGAEFLTGVRNDPDFILPRIPKSFLYRHIHHSLILLSHLTLNIHHLTFSSLPPRSSRLTTAIKAF
jgi:hypothetical protein